MNLTNASSARFLVTILSSAGEIKVQRILSYFHHPDLNMHDFRTYISTLENCKKIRRIHPNYLLERPNCIRL